MTHKISKEQLSALVFERVWVRQAEFLDTSNQKAVPSKMGEIGVKLEVTVSYSDDGARSFVTVRAVLEPPADSELFTRLAAAVEGAFSVRAGVPAEKIKTFSTVQAPVLLLPYLRQVITNLTAQARCGALVMPPINMAKVIKAMRDSAEKAELSQTTPD